MLVFLFVACVQHQPLVLDDEIDGCHLDAATVITPDDPGNIGVSAEEVIGLLDRTTLEVTFERVDDLLATATFTSEFRLSVALARDVEQQERTGEGSCIAGTVGYAPVEVQLSSADVWITGPHESTPSVTWRGGDGEVWLHLSTTAEVAQWLAADAAANFDCTSGGAMSEATGKQAFRMAVVNDVDHPWSGGPVTITVDCELGPIGTVFRSTDLAE